ncbi:MAG: HDIG domain-containing protein [Tissierellia bacterium]|nr:HDIG domain-containing protein [Tissierellia bacterium]
MGSRFKIIKQKTKDFGFEKVIILMVFYISLYLIAIANQRPDNAEHFIGLSMYLLAPFLAFILYLFNFKVQILKSKNLYLIILIMLLTIVLSELIRGVSPYLIPQATAAILLTLLLDSQIALISNAFLILIITVMFDLDLALIFIGIVANSLGILIVFREKLRAKILLDGIYIGLISAVLYLSIYFIEARYASDLILNLGYFFLSGVLASVIAIGTMPLWESIFKILTPFKLLELINPDNKLLKELSIEAPGTYHHSLLVGNLCEAAAEKIGANRLLAKAGAYYHDIGKIKRPLYFKENQFGIENPHDKLEPIQSLEIILSHSVDGLKIGKENKLPIEVIDIIDQHHGKTLMSYFYYKAKENNEMVPERKFRYKGNKPQTKEAALVMLADSVEAAVRSLNEVNDASIQKIVCNVIKSKLEDKQLDEAPITNQVIRIITEVFVSEIKGIYHNRISYPKQQF